jgi:hypothetical protein
LSDRWVEESEQLLKRMKTLSTKEERDRLEVVSSMLFILDVMERSLNGWKQWIRNLSLMSQYTLEELVEMQRSLEKQIQPLIEYDIETSKKWMEKFPRFQRVPRRIEEEEGQGKYVV